MDGLTARIATAGDVAELLRMMEDFNRLESTPWNLQQKERALRRLTRGMASRAHPVSS
jgi:hypothetical protein